MASALNSATQANQEAGTTSDGFTSPLRQQYHLSAAKFWVKCNNSGVISTSYNVTSVTDDGTGLVTITIALDFSTGSWCCLGLTQFSSGNPIRFACVTVILAGSVQLYCVDSATNLQDPDDYYVAGWGDL